MQQLLLKYFEKVNRGYFNWDIEYAKYRKDKHNFDHSLDYVINDLPEIDVVKQGNNTKVTLSPVSNKLTYSLQGSKDGKNWDYLSEYICRENADLYTFPALLKDKSIQKYRILTDMHFGLPINDTFSADKGDKLNYLNVVNDNYFPNTNGFLNITDIAGGENVKITDKSLKFKNSPQKGGSLNLKSSNKTSEVYLTKYFQEPLNTGKILVSMLLQYQALESESMAQINFLVQNGWRGNSEEQVSLSIRNDAIYCNQADIPNCKKGNSWLTNYHNQVVQVTFEFDLGATGQDKLNVYLNPDDRHNIEATATYYGEFTFDRLQFKVTGRAGGDLTVDELKIGKSLKDVWFYDQLTSNNK